MKVQLLELRRDQTGKIGDLQLRIGNTYEWAWVVAGGKVTIDGDPASLEEVAYAFHDNAYPRRHLEVVLHPLTEFYGGSKDAEFTQVVDEK